MVKNLIKRIFYMFYKNIYGSFFLHFGEFSYIKKALLIKNRNKISIGNFVKIRENSRIEAIKTWNNIVYSPLIIIDDFTTFEQSLHLICANRVIIGKNCVFSAGVFISDSNHDYLDINDNVMSKNLIVKEIEIGDTTFVGYGVVIMPGVHLGKHCVVGANSVVTKSFPDYCVIAGNPAKCIKKFDIETKSWKKTDQYGNFLIKE